MDFSQLKNILKVEHKEYKNIPFWSWNSKIEEEELVKQIVDMKSVGIDGFIMHARSGLSIEYLGEKWFSCIDACLKKAKDFDERICFNKYLEIYGLNHSGEIS